MIENFQVTKVAEDYNEFKNSLVEKKYFPMIEEENLFEVSNYKKMPLSEISNYGVAFEPLTSAFQNIVNGGSQSGLYRVTIPNGGKLAKFKDGSGNMGAVLKANGAVGGGQARLNPILCNPTMLFMAAALSNIDQKLDEIQEMQQEIIDFMFQKEKSELRGDINFLNDILNNYKFNWDNEKYKSNNHIKVLDIKQSSERKIDFYKEQIRYYIKKKAFFHSDQEVNIKIKKMKENFKEYQLALYVYSFSCFLEVMLLENFDSKYLKGIVNKIENYSIEYKAFFIKNYNQLEGYHRSSIQTNLLKGVAGASKVAGEAIAKVPIISDSQLDENLIESGDKIGKFAKKRTEETMDKFVDKQSIHIKPFIDNIEQINLLYNNPIEMLFDHDNIYLEIKN
jgi:hypothetical protein